MAKRNPRSVQIILNEKEFPLKKPIIVLIILAIALVVGAPYITGKVAETETQKMVDRAKEDPALYGKIDIVSYDRGYRSTNAKYSYTPPAFLGTIFESDTPIEYTCDSEHGILGIDYLCKLEGSNAYTDFVSEKLEGKDPLSMYGSVSVFGGITQTLEVEAIKDLDIDGQLISTPNALISVETDNEMKAFNIDGRSEAFNFEDSDSAISIGEFSFKGDIGAVAELVYAGDFDMSLENFKLKDDGNDIALTGMTWSSKNVENGDNIDSYGVAKIASIEMSDASMESVEDVKVEFEFNGIDTAALAEYQAFSMKIQREMLSSIETGQEPELDPNMMLQMLPIFESMLKPGLEINMAFDAKLNGTDNSLALESKLLEPLTFTQMAMFVTNTEEALKRLDIKLNTALAKSFIDSQPMAAGMISQSPLIETTSDAYKLKLALGEKIELNGKTLSFEELQTLVFSSMPM
jgi:uncharacterized protein YdgA (DUF945 family)